ncbi:MAG: glutathione S-transferase family protein, partial [Bradymonadaceae bacterium]
DWIEDAPEADHPPEAGRYHLYVSYACPWAHRTLITRALKGLEGAIGLSVVDPYMGEGGWKFSDVPGAIPDRVNGADYLREIYTAAAPEYTGRVTVPVLWDKERDTIVNNESEEIMRMFDTAMEGVAENDVDLYPEGKRERIDEVIDAIYQPINNGVYRAGFAETQQAYNEAVDELFEALDHWNAVLEDQRYLCGDRMTEADICMFTTLIRFDPVYHTHFKCNVRRIVDYENLWGFVRDLYQTPGVADTCNLDHITEHYYASHESVNPRGIVARGPDLDYLAPHGRGELPGEP